MNKKYKIILSFCSALGFGFAMGPLPGLTAPPAQRTALPLRTAAKTQLLAKAQTSVVYDTYILGPGDSLQVELIDIPELSGTYSIGPDGTMYLPRLRALYVEGLTVEELRYFLQQQFRAYVRNPEVYVRPVAYRPIRVYVGGEVRRPGYYTLAGVNTPQAADEKVDTSSEFQETKNLDGTTSTKRKIKDSSASIASGSSSATLFPTVFDAIRTAQGITPYSNLADVKVVRKQPLGAGGGKIQANLNFLNVLKSGDESQNIRLFDGDVVTIPKSFVVLRDQLLQAGQTNLSPQFIEVFVGGRVKQPGAVVIPQGATLNQALISAGGPKLLRGRIEFVRFTREGELDRRQFSYNPGAGSNANSNPILVAGDIINVQESALSAGVSVLQELTAPLVGVYATQQLFKR